MLILSGENNFDLIRECSLSEYKVSDSNVKRITGAVYFFLLIIWTLKVVSILMNKHIEFDLLNMGMILCSINLMVGWSKFLLCILENWLYWNMIILICQNVIFRIQASVYFSSLHNFGKIEFFGSLTIGLS